MRKLSRTSLKLIALLSMLLDHIGAVIVYPLYLSACVVDGIQMMGASIPDEAQRLYYLYMALRIVGRLAFAIFAFFIVEGFTHTHDRKKYFFRLAAFAVLSEIPFDLANTGTPFAPNYQNVLWTFAIAVVMLSLLERFALTQKNQVTKAILCVVIVIAAALCALFSDGGIGGILLIVFMYLFRNNRALYWIGCLAAIGCIARQFMWVEWFAVIGLLLLQLYDGKKDTRLKYLFYIFYPTHLLALWALTLSF